MKRLVATILLVCVAVVLAGARANTKKVMGDDYFNDIRATATGMVRFHSEATGAADGAAADSGKVKRVYFLDVFNECSSELELEIYSPGEITAGKWTAYIPDGLGRSFDGAPIDSFEIITATGIGASNPVYFTGLDAR